MVGFGRVTSHAAVRPVSGARPVIEFTGIVVRWRVAYPVFHFGGINSTGGAGASRIIHLHVFISKNKQIPHVKVRRTLTDMEA